MIDFTNPTTVAITTAFLVALLSWGYAKFILKDTDADKILAKTVLSGLVAVAIILVLSHNQSASHSLRSEPFFASVL